jgi:hypothetical protein
MIVFVSNYRLLDASLRVSTYISACEELVTVHYHLTLLSGLLG